MRTQFFTQLQEALKGNDATIKVIHSEDGRQTVLFMPVTKAGSGLIPLTLNGTPEEMNEGFLAHISRAIEVVEAKGLKTNEEEFKAAAAKAEAKPEEKKEPLKRKAPAANRISTKDSVKRLNLSAEKKAADEKSEKNPDQLEIDVTAPAPEPVKPQWTDTDLAEFRTNVEAKLIDVRDEFTFIKRMMEKGSDRFTKEEVTAMYDKQLKLISDLENAISRINDKSYGIDMSTGELILKEKLMKNPTTLTGGVTKEVETI